jgi:NAD(P)-dependent dehydrogenase (short-subunit alcohol dehydrogenase family)
MVVQVAVTALVTGANRGIGLGLVEQLAAKPEVDVFAASRRPDSPAFAQLNEKYNGKVHPVELEVVDEASVAVSTLTNTD